jgi:hypothetical protein
LTPDGATPLTYSETLPLSDATLTDQKDGSGHAIHSYLFASKISGLTQEVTYPYTLHAESTDFTGDIEKGTVTTKPDSIPVIITSGGRMSCRSATKSASITPSSSNMSRRPR